MTHIQRLRRQCEPVQEDTPVPPREHKIWVDRRDLLKLLADYDADPLLRFLSHAWSVDTKYHADASIREIKIVARDTVTMNPATVGVAYDMIIEFNDNAPGAI